MENKQPIYKRIMLKLGGESFSGRKKFGIDIDKVNFISTELGNQANGVRLLLLLVEEIFLEVKKQVLKE